MPDALPAITIWQPWATMIAYEIKPYEFRSWCAPRHLWGRRIAIHAGARAVKRTEIRDLIYRLQTDQASRQALKVGPALDLLERVWADPRILPLSSVLCTARLEQPLSPDEVRRQFTNDSDRDGHFNWAWPLRDVEVLTPFAPARGRQGWWTWIPADA